MRQFGTKVYQKVFCGRALPGPAAEAWKKEEEEEGEKVEGVIDYVIIFNFTS